MREIKFRVWDKDNKKMNYHPVLVTFPVENLVYRDTLSRDTLRRDLMQYTGLKDKNNKEIYEGDIIKASWHYDTPTEVVFNDFIYAVCEYALDDADIEILGNIYENKELL